MPPELCVVDVMVTCPKTHRPECPPEEIRALFEDDHVHMALIVAPDGRLVTTIETVDLAVAPPPPAAVAEWGTLVGRTVPPEQPVAGVTALLLRQGRRRLAVVDDDGRLVGLLCLKRDGTGFCSDEGVRERAEERLRATPLGR